MQGIAGSTVNLIYILRARILYIHLHVGIPNINFLKNLTSVRVQPSGERIQLSAEFSAPCDTPDIGAISSAPPRRLNGTSSTSDICVNQNDHGAVFIDAAVSPPIGESQSPCEIALITACKDGQC